MSIKEMVEKARVAQSTAEQWSQERVDRVVAAVGWALYNEKNAEACTRLAAEETGMGVAADKLSKHRKKTLGTLRDMHGVKSVGVIEQNAELGLVKIAKPVGVVGAITPVTNPTATPAVNALNALKGRNAVIFAPHPKARRSTSMVVLLIRKVLERLDVPVDLVQVITEPGKAAAQELMSQVDLVVATGGAGMVKAAYSSGTPAYGVGTGNAVCVVDESADLTDAARKIAQSKTFDNSSSCSSENSLVVNHHVAASLLLSLTKEGGHLCTEEEEIRVKATLWPDGEHLSPEVVAQPIEVLAAAARIEIPDGTRFLMVRGRPPVHEELFAYEKLCLVLAVWEYELFDDAVAMVEQITRLCGYGHSCGIHSNNKVHIMQLAESTHVGRVLVRQAQCYGNSGSFDNGLPFSMTLGCGTWGGNISTENIGWRHFINVTWVSEPIPERLPDEAEIFGLLRKD